MRAIVIRAEGRNFCAGADLVSANADQGKAARRASEPGPRCRRARAHLSSCGTARCPLSARCRARRSDWACIWPWRADFTIAAADATFVEPFCKRGFSVDSGGSFLLPRLVGLRRARQMLLRGIPVDATTAVEWGLDRRSGRRRIRSTASAAALATELAAGRHIRSGIPRACSTTRHCQGLDAALAQETQISGGHRAQRRFQGRPAGVRRASRTSFQRQLTARSNHDFHDHRGTAGAGRLRCGVSGQALTRDPRCAG